MKSLSEFISIVYNMANDYCSLYEGSDCPAAAAVRVIRRCLRKYPDLKDEAEKEYTDLIPVEEPVKNVPTISFKEADDSDVDGGSYGE